MASAASGRTHAAAFGSRTLTRPEEALLILLFGVLCAVASGDESYGEKIILTLTTVRISSDSIFGWMPKPQSSAVEILQVRFSLSLSFLWHTRAQTFETLKSLTGNFLDCLQHFSHRQL